MTEPTHIPLDQWRKVAMERNEAQILLANLVEPARAIVRYFDDLEARIEVPPAPHQDYDHCSRCGEALIGKPRMCAEGCEKDAWDSPNTRTMDYPHPFRARPSSPTGETPCVTCGGTGQLILADHDRWPIIPCHACQPTGETAGQGVEEAWVRGSDWDGYVTYLNPSTGGREKVSLAVEQAIRADALAEYAEGHDMHCENEARATAAEAERDRLRADLAAAHANQDSLARVVDSGGQLDQLTEERDRLREALEGIAAGGGFYRLRARRALAGESTGAATDDRPPLKHGDGQQVTR